MESLSVLASLLRIAVLAYLGFLLLLWLMQERLLFYPQPVGAETLRVLRERVPEVQELALTAGDGARLHGWLRHVGDERPAPLLIYFGGNAEEVSSQIIDAERYAPFSVAAFNYRGYGSSEGSPGQDALFADALDVYDSLAAREDIDATRIVALGRSLGSGVAVHLAAERELAGVVLISPYDSVLAVAQRLYPLVPVSWLLRHPFDSLAQAPRLTLPALVLATPHDRTIPVSHSERLHAAWGGPARWVTVDGAGHADIDSGNGYWQAVTAFLEPLAAGRTPGGLTAPGATR